MSTWIEIDLKKLAHNYHHLEKITEKPVFGVVKDNAYGHGDVAIAQELCRQGVKILCVFSVEEAVHLRANGVECDILVFGFTPRAKIEEHSDLNLIYTAPSIEWYETILDLSITVRLHLEINTGMNRIGLREKEDVISILKGPHQVEGIYTHFGNPTNIKIGEKQLARFERLLRYLKFSFTWVHVGNAPVELIKNTPYVNASRFGLGIYGYRDGISGLAPVLSLYTEIDYISTVEKGETIGYDYTYEVKEDLLLGTIPVGYANGFDVRNAALDVIIDGEWVCVLGKICMNQMMIKLSDTHLIHARVELIGSTRTAHLIHEKTGIMPYILLTCLSSNIERIYV